MDFDTSVAFLSKQLNWDKGKAIYWMTLYGSIMDILNVCETKDDFWASENPQVGITRDELIEVINLAQNQFSGNPLGDHKKETPNEIAGINYGKGDDNRK